MWGGELAIADTAPRRYAHGRRGPSSSRGCDLTVQPTSPIPFRGGKKSQQCPDDLLDRGSLLGQLGPWLLFFHLSAPKGTFQQCDEHCVWNSATMKFLLMGIGCGAVASTSNPCLVWQCTGKQRARNGLIGPQCFEKSPVASTRFNAARLLG